MKLWAPKVRHCHISPITLSFLFFFSFFLSSLLIFLSLFLCIYSSFCSSLEQKAHTHRPLTWSLTRRPTPITHKPITHTRPLNAATPTQTKRSSTLIFDHTPKRSTTQSFSSLLLLYSFFDLAVALKSTSTAMADLRWKQLETIRSGSLFFDLEALLSAIGIAPLEARF